MNTNTNFTVNRITAHKIEVIVDWADVDSIDEAVNLSLELEAVKNLNPGSDYTEQNFDIEVSTNRLYIYFRKEQEVSF